MERVPSLFRAVDRKTEPVAPTSYPPLMRAAVPGVVLSSAPVRGVANGNTDYLDCVEAKEFDDTAVIRGTDRFRRPFVAFMLEVQAPYRTGVFVLFQRYSPPDDHVVACVNSHAGGGDSVFRDAVEEVLEMSCRVTEKGAQRLREVLEGGWVQSRRSETRVRLRSPLPENNNTLGGPGLP